MSCFPFLSFCGLDADVFDGAPLTASSGVGENTVRSSGCLDRS